MDQQPTGPPPRRSRLTLGLLAVALLLPVGIWAGLTYAPLRGEPLAILASPVSHFPPSALRFDRQALGSTPAFRPQIANVKVVDLDRDGLPDVIVCDAQRNRVFWYRQLPGGKWDEFPLGDELNCPACATPVDLDGDGDLDLVVAVLGSVYPTDDRVGQVVWLENLGGLAEAVFLRGRPGESVALLTEAVTRATVVRVTLAAGAGAQGARPRRSQPAP